MERKGILIMSMLFIAYGIFAYTPKAAIKWEALSLDFGKIPVNVPVTAEFKFSNPGMIPVIISEVKPSCGCTVADYPKEPILSGGEGKISVTFDAKLSGYFSKTISVYTNTETGMHELFIKGEVIK